MQEHLLSGTAYLDRFDTSAYLKKFESWESSFRVNFPSRCYHEAFQSLPNGLRVLDYGSGPSIVSIISAAAKASEIVLSDYGEGNRKALRQWLERDPEAFDWSPTFNMVVQEYEGRSEEEARKREEQVRKVVKAVALCDLHQDPPIEEAYNSQYDVVICSMVLEVTSKTREDYKKGIAKLRKLVKPGGKLMLYTGERISEFEKGYYMVGDAKFHDILVSSEFVVQSFIEAGFGDVAIKKLPVTDINDPTLLGAFFLVGELHS